MCVGRTKQFSWLYNYGDTTVSGSKIGESGNCMKEI